MVVKRTVANIAVYRVGAPREIYRDLLGLGAVIDHDRPSRQSVVMPAKPYFHELHLSLWFIIC